MARSGSQLGSYGRLKGTWFFLVSLYSGLQKMTENFLRVRNMSYM